MMRGSSALSDPQRGGSARRSSVAMALLGNGDGSIQTPQFFGPTTDPLEGTSALGGADFNGDSKGDLALQGNPSFLDTAEIYLGNGDGTFSKTKSYTLSNPPQQNSFGIAIADFNGDGKPDIAVFESCAPREW
jgi:hypothetical protein